ncbi:FAD-dependent oxidoreductase [Telmatospirillum sp.]|uniref:FAD-dependent oxidoreductase n=1 Tax=Telmatospirillum sp. TaxID=2079197 RepID=UPI0028481D0F|nr:FAD-dependent oxidoreductase [Telmatospirillum sp.]MDR3440201.1 FAD-dependent oxidoreductase [Telmatospirillum sp.]
MGMALTEPVLGFSLSFFDLYNRDGLGKVDQAFLSFLGDIDADLQERLQTARETPPDARQESDLLVEVAPHLDDFIGRLFGIGGEIAALAGRQQALAPLYACKRLFVQRRAQKAVKADEAENIDGPALEKDLSERFGGAWDELDFARHVMTWLDDETNHSADLSLAERYAAWALLSTAGKARHKNGRLFKAPSKHDPMHLVPHETVIEASVPRFAFAADKLRHRDGFDLTDQGCDLTGALDEVNYCILCHHQGKDSCSKGMRDKKTGAFAKTALGATQTGCPLEERISEMHEVKGKGLSVAALAVAVVDNAMVAGTGHRICNDCMTGCIYTNGNKDAVNIPEAETRTLKDVLELPWGFEIYSLLTRWNPLNLRRPLPKAASGRSVLVVGLGPAGYTLAHHLMNDGHAVVAIDGLKIEPLPESLSGVKTSGERVPFRAIRDIAELTENLGERVMAGFGGVAEYGITVRWNKNFLKVIRLLLERRSEFLMAGGIRLGGTLTMDDAFAMGFDHIALCMGAGRPTIIDMPNNLAHGVRQASDFLMGLQLTGAARADTLASLQVRLPVVVIGGGLTAIDACTEALAYYPVQVEKFRGRYETLVAERGEEAVRLTYTPAEAAIADEYLAHARAIRAERQAAAEQGRAPELAALLQSWGGATVAYRRRLVESPAYRNHEEVAKAFEEGIHFAEQVTPRAVEIDGYGHAVGLRVKTADGAEAVLPARTIIVAAGTVPNTVLAREEDGIALDGKYFQAVDEEGLPVAPERLTKPSTPQVLMSVESHGGRRRTVSFFGDLHPSYAGNVVSAMASAKQGYPVVSRMLEKLPAPITTPEAVRAGFNQSFRPTVHHVQRLAPSIIEVVIKAPAAARAFQPGQFYRLQNFETLAKKNGGTTLAMEGLALTGAWVDKEAGLVSVIVLEMGGSSDLCRILQPGEPVVLMGPTGAPTETPAGETVLLAGGGLGNAVLFSIGQALRRAGSKVLYFAGYRSAVDRFKVEEIEAAADKVVWCVDRGDALTPGRAQDQTFVGNIVQAMVAYAEGRLGPIDISLHDVDRIIAIGSDRMMQAVAEARHGVLGPHLRHEHQAIGSINSPMQCMMKEICAQCLQKQRDPATGEEIVVFTCANQDQPLDQVDFKGLNQRLGQNTVQEKLTRQWIDRSLRQLALRQ